jgi:hypothetical protein
MLSVIKLNVILLNAIMLSVMKLNVFMLSVVARYTAFIKNIFANVKGLLHVIIKVLKVN